MKHQYLKYLSILVFVSGLIVWGMIGLAKIREINTPVVTTDQFQVVVPRQETEEIAAAVVPPSAESSTAPGVDTSDQPQNTANVGSPGLPKTLIIPKIGLNTVIESVGLDSAARMDVPKNWRNVAWYNLGYKVGDLGSAVIDGHLDTVAGGPAAFYKINTLEVGDLVTVLDDRGQSFNFRVMGKQSYDFDKLPLQQIFASSGTAELNLITCAGIWDKNSFNYTQRIVVNTKME